MTNSFSAILRPNRLLGYSDCLISPLDARRKAVFADACTAPRPAVRGFWTSSRDDQLPYPFDCEPEAREAPRYALKRAVPFVEGPLYVESFDATLSRTCEPEPLNPEVDYFVPGEVLDPALVAEIHVETPMQ